MDLKKAKELLVSGNYTCVICKEEEVYTSEFRGVKPLVSWYANGSNFAGFSAADKVVGRATAFLYLLLGVKAVYSGVISEAALEVLEKNGVDVSCEQLVPHIINRKGDGICPFEMAVMECEDKMEAYKAIRKKMKEMGIEVQVKQEKLLADFFAQTDENGISNLEKAKTRAKVIRRISSTDKNKSYEEVQHEEKEGALPGVVIEDGKLIGFGIHIYNEDVYPLQSFEIYLRGCDLIGDLQLTDAKDMVFLDLYNNRISSVELGEMPEMKILGVQNNQIASLNPTRLENCLGIDAGKNRLEELDVSKNTKLVELYVNDNQISEIDLSHNPDLKYFYCHNNNMESLDTTKNVLLRHLNATGNPMKWIRSLAPQREEVLPLELYASEGGYVGLKFNPIYTAQWKETGKWEQSYQAVPMEGKRFVGWFDEKDELVSNEENWVDEYGASRILTAKFE